MQQDDTTQCLVAVLVIALVVAFKGGIGYAIGNRKGRGGLGFVLGLFLGIIGGIIIAVLPGETAAAPSAPRRCRQCSRLIPRGSLKCPHCRPAGAGGRADPADDRVPCTHCAELILRGAHVCRFCHNKVSP